MIDELNEYELEGRISNFISFKNGDVWIIDCSRYFLIRQFDGVYSHIGNIDGSGCYTRTYSLANDLIFSISDFGNGTLQEKSGKAIKTFPSNCSDWCDPKFTQDKEGHLWFTGGVFSKYDSAGNLITAFPDVSARLVTPRMEGGVYIFMEELNGSGSKIKTIDQNNQVCDVADSPDYVYDMTEISSGKLALSSGPERGVYVLDVASGSSKQMMPPEGGDFLRGVFVDTEQRPWALTKRGVTDESPMALCRIGANNEVVFSHDLGPGDWRAWPDLVGNIWACQSRPPEQVDGILRLRSTLHKLRYRPLNDVT